MKVVNIYLDEIEYKKLFRFKESNGWTWKEMLMDRYNEEEGDKQ